MSLSVTRICGDGVICMTMTDNEYIRMINDTVLLMLTYSVLFCCCWLFFLYFIFFFIFLINMQIVYSATRQKGASRAHCFNYRQFDRKVSSSFVSTIKCPFLASTECCILHILCTGKYGKCVCVCVSVCVVSF